MEREVPFTGRSAELGVLQESLSGAVDGHASVVLLTGEATTVGCARGAPLEREFAFGVTRQMFRGTARGDRRAAVL